MAKFDADLSAGIPRPVFRGLSASFTDGVEVVAVAD